jgi:Uncharacterized protein conserved in bacteria (DUF2147)
MRWTPRALAAGLLLAPIVAGAQTSGPVGVWLTQKGDAQVRVAPCGAALCGTIVWLKDPIDSETGRPITDKAQSRSRPPQQADHRAADHVRHDAERAGPLVGTFLQQRRRQDLSGQSRAARTDLGEGGRLLSDCMGETWQRVK